MPKRSPNFNPLRAVRRVTRVARTVSHADHQRMYWGRWRRASVLFLDGHPFCVRCEEAGRAVPATVTDHVIPHRGDDRLFWDERNWQPLCKLCHDRKTASEDGGLGRARTGEGAAVHGTGNDDAFAEYCATMGAGMAEASVQRTDGGMPHAPKRATWRGSSTGSGAPTEGGVGSMLRRPRNRATPQVKKATPENTHGGTVFKSPGGRSALVDYWNRAP